VGGEVGCLFPSKVVGGMGVVLKGYPG